MEGGFDDALVLRQCNPVVATSTMEEGQVGLWERHGGAVAFLWSVGGKQVASFDRIFVSDRGHREVWNLVWYLAKSALDTVAHNING